MGHVYFKVSEFVSSFLVQELDCGGGERRGRKSRKKSGGGGGRKFSRGEDHLVDYINV